MALLEKEVLHQLRTFAGHGIRPTPAPRVPHDCERDGHEWECQESDYGSEQGQNAYYEYLACCYCDAIATETYISNGIVEGE